MWPASPFCLLLLFFSLFSCTTCNIWSKVEILNLLPPLNKVLAFRKCCFKPTNSTHQKDLKLSHCLEIDTEEISMTQPKYDTHVVNRDLANNWNFSLNYEKMKSYRKVLLKTSTRQVYNGPWVVRFISARRNKCSASKDPRRFVKYTNLQTD